MKTTKITLQGGGQNAYLPPVIEQFTVEIEAGFAQSLGGANEAGAPLEENGDYTYEL